MTSITGVGESSSVRAVLTYGTFDLFHIGHLRLLERARRMGDYLIVGVSTDEFNARKGKTAIHSFRERQQIVASLRCVDLVIPEVDWDQKADDIASMNVRSLVMGDDWRGKFDHLGTAACDVRYLTRTEGVSSSLVREQMRKLAA